MGARASLPVGCQYSEGRCRVDLGGMKQQHPPCSLAWSRASPPSRSPSVPSALTGLQVLPTPESAAPSLWGDGVGLGKKLVASPLRITAGFIPAPGGYGAELSR